MKSYKIHHHQLKKSTKKKRSHIGLIIFTILLVVLLGILGVNYKRFASKQLTPVRDNKVVKHLI